MSDDWQESAACKSMGTKLFYEERGHSVDVAKAICASCPVIEDCLDFALQGSSYGDAGVWGGTTPEERRLIRRQRRIPPKRRAVAECGTTGGYDRHQRLREVPCEPCREAKAAYNRERYEQRQKRKYGTP